MTVTIMIEGSVKRNRKFSFKLQIRVRMLLKSDKLNETLIDSCVRMWCFIRLSVSFKACLKRPFSE